MPRRSRKFPPALLDGSGGKAGPEPEEITDALIDAEPGLPGFAAEAPPIVPIDARNVRLKANSGPIGWTDPIDARRCETLEDLFTSPDGFGMACATPLQRAICRIAEGRDISDLVAAPMLANAEEYPAEIRERATWEWALGDYRALPSAAPRELYIVGPVRCGKSMLAAAIVTNASQRCDISGLRPGEMPRASVVSITKDLAEIVHRHIVGHVDASEELRKLLLGLPTVETILLQHPSGRSVEIKVVAGSRAGATLVGRWSAGAVFDEFTRMHGSESTVVNFDDSREAVLARLLPGAQIVGIGSPWTPYGPAYDLVQRSWRKPTEQVVTIRAVGPAMNPHYWTPAKCAEVRQNYQVYKTDVLGEFADPESGLLTSEELRRVTRKARTVAPASDAGYVAALVLTPRADGFAVVVLTRKRDGKLSVALAREWRTDAGAADSLDPRVTLGRIARALGPYSVARIACNQSISDAVYEMALGAGLFLARENMTGPKTIAMFESLRATVRARDIEFPAFMEDDLRRVQRRGNDIELPRANGRNCEWAYALALALHNAGGLQLAAQEEGPPPGWTREEHDSMMRYAEQLRSASGEWDPYAEESDG
jgi:hypothetical protein